MIPMANEIKVASGELVKVSAPAFYKGCVVVWRANAADNRGQEVLILKPLDALRLAVSLVDTARAELDRE